MAVNALLKRFQRVLALLYFELRTVTARSHMFYLLLEKQAIHVMHDSQLSRIIIYKQSGKRGAFLGKTCLSCF